MTTKKPAAAPAAPTRDPAKVQRYKEAIVRLGKLQPGAPEYQKNADIVQSIGTEYGLQWQDKVKTAPAPVVNPGQPVIPGQQLVPQQSDTMSPEGAVNQNEAAARLEAQRRKDAEDQFKRDNPDEVDEYGNTVTYTMGPDGKAVRTVKQGETAQKFSKMALAAAEGYDPAADRAKAEEATYGTLTKYYDRDMAKEQEDAKQELANRGIPYDPAAAQDPNTKNLYGRTVGGITQRYQGLRDTAQQQAVLSGNEAFRTTSTARDSLLNSLMTGSNTYGSDFKNYVNNTIAKSGDDSITLLSMSADQYAKLRGISVQEAQAKIDNAREDEKLKEVIRANKAGEKLTQAQINKPTGGGGGGSGSSGQGGFELPG